MAKEVTLRIKVKDAQQAAAAIEKVNEALLELGASAEVVNVSSADLEKQEKSLGDKIASLTEKIAITIGIHAAWGLASKKLAVAAKGLTASSTTLTAAVGALTAKVGAAKAGFASFTSVAVAGLKAGLIGLALVISAKLTIGLGKLLDRMGRAGAALAVTRQGFGNLAKGINETADSLQNRLRKATLGTVDDLELLQVGNRALLTGVAKTGKEFEELARLSTILALGVGKEAAEGFDILTTGIARHSTQLLKGLGIVVDTNDAYRDYAASLGTTTDKLTGNQRATAFQNKVLEVARQNVRRLNLDTDNLAVINAQATTSIVNLRLAFEREVAESKQLIAFRKELLGLTTDLTRSSQSLAPTIGLITDAYFLQARGIFQAAFGAGRLGKEMGKLAAEYLGLSSAIAGTNSRLAENITHIADLERLRVGAAPFFPGVPEVGEDIGLPALPERLRAPGPIGVTGTVPSDFFNQALGPEGVLAQAIAAQEAGFQALFGDDLVERLDRAIDAQGRFMEVMIDSQFQVEEVDEATREYNKGLAELTKSAEEGGKQLSQRWVGAIEGMVSATIQGGNAIQVAFSGMLNALVREVQSSLSGSGFRGALAGGLFGGLVLGVQALVMRGSRSNPINVRQVEPININPDSLPAREFILQVVARDPTDRAAVQRIIEEINASGQFDRPFTIAPDAVG